MAERRALIEGLETITDADPELAADFVFQNPKPRPPKNPPTSKTAPPPADSESPARPPVERVLAKEPSPLLGLGRVPVGARIRTELAVALKRASLERQLQGIEPNSIQDILEEALTPWLERHGYLT
jgi:hypothetical protein